MKVEIGDKFLLTGLNSKPNYYPIVKSIGKERILLVSNLDENHRVSLKKEELEKYIETGFWIKLNSTNN